MRVRLNLPHYSLLALLLALCHFGVLLPLIGFAPIGGSSEAREVHIARIVFETGQWVLPSRDGLLPSKPLLFHWITALWGLLAGEVGPFAARLTTLIFSSLMVLLTALLAMRVVDGNSAASRFRTHAVGILAAAVLTTTYGFQNLAADARVDVTASALVLLAIAPIFATLACRESKEAVLAALSRSRQWEAFYLVSGLAVLAKGPLGIVLPGIVVAALLCARCGFSTALRHLLTPRIGWIYFIIVAVPWYLAAWRLGGEAFIQKQLLFENLQRFTGGEDVNSEAFWFYVPSFLRTGFPWSILAFASFPALIRYGSGLRSREAALETPGRRAEFLAALWFWVGFLFLSAASGKRHSYLLPFYPALAVFVALRIDRFQREMSDSLRARLIPWVRSLPWIFAGLLFLTAAAFDLIRAPLFSADLLMQEVGHFLSRISLRVEVLCSLALAVLAHAKMRNGGPARSDLALCFAAIVLSSVLVYSGLAVKNFMKGFDRAAYTINRMLPEETRLSVVREAREEFFDPLMFYLRRPVSLVNRGEVRAACPGALVVRTDDFHEIAGRNTDLRIRVLGSFATLAGMHRLDAEPEYYLVECQLG